jgi:hypothetical protein
MAGMIAKQNHMNFAYLNKFKLLFRYARVLLSFSEVSASGDSISVVVSSSSVSMDAGFSGNSGESSSVVY